LGGQPRGHGRGQFDPVDVDAPAGQRQCEASGADAEFKGAPRPGEVGEETHRRVDHLGIEQLRPQPLVPSGDPLVEQGFGHPQSIRRRAHPQRGVFTPRPGTGGPSRAMNAANCG
jgi:hypothetical protein